jgi:hypothetical protein
MATSAPGEDPIYVVTTGEDGYGFSLTRFGEDPLIELMVADQTNCPTSELSAELRRDRLIVRVSPAEVADIGIPTEYVVMLAMSEADMARIDAILAAIFAGVGRYTRRL